MSVLDRKLLRDLRSLRGQVITIALVVACGIASYVTMRSAYDSLLRSRDAYYESHRFADAFVNVKRAPEAVRTELEAISGVADVQTRIVEQVLVPLDPNRRAASGTVVSLDSREEGDRLNDVYVKRGRTLEPRRADEVLVIEGFAEAHGLEPGDHLPAVINGTLRELRIVGIVLSPEYVMTLAPGQLSYDPGSSPVLWMNETALEAAFQLEGAFNSATFRLSPGANLSRVLSSIDRKLERFGSFGAIARDKQTSNYMLQGELTQLDNMAAFVPYLFLGVAALLVNVVLSRLVQLQRNVIATLKAIGYRGLTIGLHYLKLVSTIVLLGAVLGVAGGVYLGRAMMQLYTGQFFRFPDPGYHLGVSTVVVAVGVSLLSAVAGAWISVRGVATLPPAEAMQPPRPARYRRSLLEHVGIWHWLEPNVRMIWREVSRRPLRLALSSVGISLAVGILVVARSMGDSIDYLIDVQFQRSMRENLSVTLVQPVDAEAVRSLEAIPGVFLAEGMRMVPVRFRAGHRYRDAAINGYPEGLRMRRLLDSEARAHEIPREGLLLTSKLAEILDVSPGDRLTVEIREGDFATRQVTVAGLVEEPFGLAGHMSSHALSELVRDSGPVTTALLSIDPAQQRDVERRLQTIPQVVTVASPRDFKRQFNEQSAGVMNVFTAIMTFFACVIAVGVIYNNARVALSQRSRDLASLRVLGFTKREIATILFGEQAVQVVLAVPLGLVVGRAMAIAMMSNVDPETYRMPVLISTQTYLFATAVTILAAFFSALLLRRKLEKLDLIGVLKTRQ